MHMHSYLMTGITTGSTALLLEEFLFNSSRAALSLVDAWSKHRLSISPNVTPQNIALQEWVVRWNEQRDAGGQCCFHLDMAKGLQY